MPLKSYLEAINKEIQETTFGSNPVELYEPLIYILTLGGKRIRPCLTLMAANLWLYNWQKAIKPALAVEVFHNFTLIHDDIMDQAPIRRGQATVHAKWDTNRAILSGDVMLISAYKLLEGVEDRIFKRVITRFNIMAGEVCEGQQMDMLFSKKDNVSKEEYIEMIRLKTSVLLGFALELGALIAEADDESVALLNNIGVNIGIGFQLQDDILDAFGDPKTFGKQTGGDIIENKKTYLLIEAIEKTQGTEDKDLLVKLLNTKKIADEDKITQMLAIYEKYDIKDAAERKMNKYFREAHQGINKLKISDDKKNILKTFVENLLIREK